MARTAHNAVYNSRIPRMPILTSRFARGAGSLLGTLLVLQSALMWADSWSGPEEQLAEKIVAVTGPGAMAVNVSNRSALRTADADEIRRGLLTQLASLGARFVKPEQAAATVNVFLSEDLQNFVWVAEIRQSANESSVVMVSLPRPEAISVEREASPLIIRKTLLWSQEDRILDAAIIEGNPSHMAVLDPKGVAVYRLQDSHPQLEQTLPIPHLRPWPRDLRGRLVLRKDHLLDAFLPGVFCRSTASTPLTLNCFESDDPWPIGTDLYSLNAFFAPSRNFFTGALAPGVGKQTTAPPFYAAAALPREKYTLWLFTTVDGQVHLLDGITDQVAGKLAWGSDIAGVQSGCGSGWQVLAAGNGDNTRDTLRAFEIPDREPVAASEPLDFNGSITALWAESSGASAIAVARNSETRKYEAFRLTIGCGGR